MFDLDADRLGLIFGLSPVEPMADQLIRLAAVWTGSWTQKDNPCEMRNVTLDRTAKIQRTLEFGTWEEIRWLVVTYGIERIRTFVRLRGERMLSAVTFTYWRKLLGVRRWRRSPFAREAKQVWPY